MKLKKSLSSSCLAHGSRQATFVSPDMQHKLDFYAKPETLLYPSDLKSKAGTANGAVCRTIQGQRRAGGLGWHSLRRSSPAVFLQNAQGLVVPCSSPACLTLTDVDIARRFARSVPVASLATKPRIQRFQG
jgi:hypothetical protein